MFRIKQRRLTEYIDSIIAPNMVKPNYISGHIAKQKMMFKMNDHKMAYCAANSRVGVSTRTLIAWMRLGRNSNLSKTGKVNAAVCMKEQHRRVIQVKISNKSFKSIGAYTSLRLARKEIILIKSG